MPTLTTDGPIWTLHLGEDENRFSPDWLAAATKLLDEVADSDEPAALVTTASGKFFSNGLDLEWLGQHPDQLGSYVDSIHALFAQVLTLPVPTVAAINGHAFGGGAMLAMAHDHRVMRSDRGYFCFPEVDIQIPFTEGMSALITAKLTPQAAVTSMLTGRRFGGAEAAATGLVDAATDLGQLPGAAADLVRDRAGKHRPTLGTIKQTMYAHVVEALARPQG
ncbi:enoyl-CoA hydratase/isomerase family protein [Nocardioides solisilvae]|uniref:enoyl-CoA hydratase/isomerase family protein n=1 Tax=Nocardioides solisilvae TaxID=1542435 RepID=UPI000D740CBE|nr:enoyl-CoA hydratase/isomerase family protein [Nocardioides solisilvae]